MSSVLDGGRERVFGFVKEFIEDNGYPPTVRQIGLACDYRSTATVQMHLDALRRTNFLQGEGRTLQVVKSKK